VGRSLRSVAVLGAVVALAGCFDDPPPPVAGADAPPPTAVPGLDGLPEDAGYDVCDLVPVDLVNQDLGLSLPPGRARDNEPDERVCQYGDYSFDGSGDVLVGVYVAAGIPEAEAIFDDVVFIVSARPVDGIGDEAAEAPFSSRFVVREGNVVVDVYGESGQARLGADDAELRQLALDVLGLSVTLPGASTGDAQTAP
jgi:hypothetical protein